MTDVLVPGRGPEQVLVRALSRIDATFPRRAVDGEPWSPPIAGGSPGTPAHAWDWLPVPTKRRG